LDKYRYADSKKTLENGEKEYIQNVLKYEYGDQLRELLAQNEAIIYVCGAEAAKEGVDNVLAEIAGFKRDSAEAKAFINDLESKCVLQSTASKPERFFNKWKDVNPLTDHRMPMSEKQRENNPDNWTRRVLPIAEIREGKAAKGYAQRA